MEKIRVLFSKSSLDAHDRGMRYIAQLLREAGMEVVYTRYNIIDEVIKQAMEEDVDVVGLSFYGSGLMHDCKKFMEMKKRENLDVLFIVGGTIMDFEKDKLQDMGVSGVFQPNVGSPEDIVTFIQSKLAD